MKFCISLVSAAALTVVGLTVCVDHFNISLGHSGPDRVQQLIESKTAASSTHTENTLLPVEKTDDQWRELLTEEQYYVTRRKGTEPPGSGKHWDNKEPGIYRCVCCDLELFDSVAKFDSGTGWPSFFQPIDQDHIKLEEDRKIWFQRRVEVLCLRCNAHLGHVFPDGPDPTGLRYCLNSAALQFEERDTQEENNQQRKGE